MELDKRSDENLAGLIRLFYKRINKYIENEEYEFVMMARYRIRECIDAYLNKHPEPLDLTHLGVSKSEDNIMNESSYIN